MATRKTATAQVIDLPVAPMRTAAAAATKGLDAIADPKMLTVRTQGQELATKLNAVTVTDENGYKQVLELCRVAKGVIDFIEQSFAEPVADFNKAHKGLIKLRDETFGLKALAMARDSASRKTGQWYRAEEERKRRKLIEEQAAAEQEANLARQLELEDLHAEGRTEEAEELAATPIELVAPLAAPEPVAPKVTGAAYVAAWKMTVLTPLATQLRELADQIRGIAPELEPVVTKLHALAEFSVFDDQRLGQIARTIKSDCVARLAAIGVRVFDDGANRTSAA